MKAHFEILRKRPEDDESYRQEFTIEVSAGQVVLDVFHKIQEEIDPTFAFRYSCRGAICGSCAVRINGKASLACKTQVLPLAQNNVVVIDPLANMKVIKDLVCDFSPFWESFNRVKPFLARTEEAHDDKFIWDETVILSAQLDQHNRSIDCIKCAACFSDCPKRAQEANFIGPAASVELYKFLFDPRDGIHEWRSAFAGAPGGVFDCDKHANCVKVCPKDVRPLRAINFIRNEIDFKKDK